MNFAERVVDLQSPKIMGILNVTPDSFYDGGKFYQNHQLKLDKAVRQAVRMVEQGAAFIDVGGESTRPGAEPVTAVEECDRVLPVLERLVGAVDAVISVDTSNPVLMQEAARLGAGLINDVRALESPGAMAAAVETGLPVCLMHMHGTPKTMQSDPQDVDAFSQVYNYLKNRRDTFVASGGDCQKVILDPGFGFGKTDAHNLSLLKLLPRFLDLGHPLLVGLSRKSLIGRLLNREPEDRLAASLALAMEALRRGATLLRVHDVQETVDVLKIMKMLGESE